MRPNSNLLNRVIINHKHFYQDFLNQTYQKKQQVKKTMRILKYNQDYKIQFPHNKLTINCDKKQLMINIQSPSFSTCSKAQLLSRLSPTFRNKRVPSAQDNYSQPIINHKGSFRKHSSPSKCLEKAKRSKSKKNLTNSAEQQIYTQVNYLKQQYKSLKDAYHDLIQQKIRSSQQINSLKHQNSRLNQANEELIKENQKAQAKMSFYESQIERIKKQCLKMIEIEQFKTKKLEQNLLEREKAIKSLLDMSTISNSKMPDFKAHSIQINETTKVSEQQLSPMFPLNRQPALQSITQNHSQYLSISLTSLTEQSYQRFQPTTKRKNKQDENKMIEVKQPKDNKEKVSKKESVANANGHQNIKKMRKELQNKLQINIDSNTFGASNPTLKTPHEPNKPIKSKLGSSKSKTKKGDEQKQNQTGKSWKRKNK